MTFGQRLYELRRSKNISQEEFAELLDVSRQSISKWENDKAYPEMTRLLFMSDYFDVSLDYLMRGTEAPQSKQEADKNYDAKDWLLVWNTFVTNLSAAQRKLMAVLCLLLAGVCLAAIFNFIYGAGYEIGKFIYHLKN
ncbi:MAG: helix-turn-helix transcriptional regulator [Clostridia bacterium]|nr:helix-turn-helix transcriptional regulator [Clostridia bacterium]